MTVVRPVTIRLALAAGALALVAAACGVGEETSEPLDQATAAEQLAELADEIGWIDNPIGRTASIPPPTGANLADTLPPITEFPIRVEAPSGADTVVEVWSSTEKSGELGTTDGWMTEVAEKFNDAGITLSDGSVAGVDLRSIASGTGYQFIARGQELPDGFTPSSQLWIEMAGEFQTMTEITPNTVDNVAGIVMKDETAEELRATYGDLSAANLVDAVIAGDLVMGYTDPFASSTGLNFLLTVLDTIAEGDPARLTSPDVASVFEQFQRQVPFVALTTLQMRDSVENDTGTLDTFVMEWQTFTNTESLQSGFEFIPFGVPHDNPLAAVGDLSASRQEALQLFTDFAARPEFQELAVEYGFDPPPYTPTVEVPSGSTLIDVQNVWKDKKDGGRPVATVFVVDVSGSMEGTRIQSVQTAMQSSARVHQADHRGRCRRVLRHRGEASRHRRVRPQPTGALCRHRRGPRAGRRNSDVRRHRARAADARGAANGKPRHQADPRGAHRRRDDGWPSVRGCRRRDRGSADPDLHRWLRSRPRRTRTCVVARGSCEHRRQ